MIIQSYHKFDLNYDFMITKPSIPDPNTRPITADVNTKFTTADPNTRFNTADPHTRPTIADSDTRLTAPPLPFFPVSETFLSNVLKQLCPTC